MSSSWENLMKLPSVIQLVSGLAGIQTGLCVSGTSQVALRVKNLPANAANVRGSGSIPGSGRSPGRGYENPLQYSYLENPVDRGAWWATVHRVTKRWTQLKWLSMHAPMGIWETDVFPRVKNRGNVRRICCRGQIQEWAPAHPSPLPHYSNKTITSWLTKKI